MKGKGLGAKRKISRKAAKRDREWTRIDTGKKFSPAGAGLERSVGLGKANG
jgi:hypothetical protein